jgi:nucleoside-diphosphate-sugar epimerase
LHLLGHGGKEAFQMIGAKVLVTGAAGFVGEGLIFRLLLDRRYRPIAAARGQTRLLGLCPVQSFDLLDEQCLIELDDVKVVVHAAARVHVLHEQSENALSEFRKVNVQGTLKLAKRAAQSGVKRFIFISSIKVNGESTQEGKPFTADDQARPLDPYGVSKHEAEVGLIQLGRDTGMEIVIIRPPLVYGPGVKANFLSMLIWLDRGLPLPLGAIRNQRSLVALDNLISLVVTCIDHPAASGQVFLVSDGEDVSTTQLLRLLSEALDKTSCLIPVPQAVLKVVAQVIGKGDVAQRICGSLQVDIEKTRKLLDWTPPEKMKTAALKTAIYYREEHAK